MHAIAQSGNLTTIAKSTRGSCRFDFFNMGVPWSLMMIIRFVPAGEAGNMQRITD
jgi:hypothetical protein